MNTAVPPTKVGLAATAGMAPLFLWEPLAAVSGVVMLTLGWLAGRERATA